MDLGQDLFKERRRSTREVKKSLFLSDGFDPFVWFKLEGAGITERTVHIDKKREIRQRTLTFSTTFFPRSSGLPGNLNRGRAMVKSSPFFP